MSLALFSVVSGAKWTTKMLQSVCLQFCPGRSVNWLDYYTFRSFTASINCCKNILPKQSHNYGVWNYWQQKLLYCICYTIWIDWHVIFGLEQKGESLIAPMALAHPLHPIDNRSRNRRRNLWVGWYVSSWWPLFPSGSSVFIYICMHFLYEFCYRTNLYIQQECHSVLVKLHPITFYKTVFLGSAQFLGWMPLFVFFGLPILSNSLMIIV